MKEICEYCQMQNAAFFRDASAEIRSHLEKCEECRSYAEDIELVERYLTVSAVPDPEKKRRNIAELNRRIFLGKVRKWAVAGVSAAAVFTAVWLSPVNSLRIQDSGLVSDYEWMMVKDNYEFNIDSVPETEIIDYLAASGMGYLND